MGSKYDIDNLLSSPSFPGHDLACEVFTRERVEKKLAVAKLRSELEISAWLENVSVQLTDIGRDLIEEVDMTVNQLLMQAREKEISEENLDIKFVPRSLRNFEFGYLCEGGILPSSLSLELLTSIPDISAGTRLSVSVETEKGITPMVRRCLAVSVLNESAEPVPCQEEIRLSPDSRSLVFSFTASAVGQLTVAATLYRQHVAGSPLVIPVLATPALRLGLMGLGVLGQDQSGQRENSMGSSVVAKIKTISPLAKPEVKYVMGDLCFAKWDHNGVWYNAKIDKDCRERGIEVTFVDYDNSDFVQRENIVWRKEELPEGEVVDLGPDVIAAGDQGVAKWTEDGIWYNARVLGHEGLGYSVFFTDYENIAFVESGQIFQDVTDIPQGERLDIHVEMLLESVEQVNVKSSLEARKIVKSVPKWSVGNLCLVRWAEDGRWYNARVDSVYHSSDVWSGEYLVTFTDYGNSEIVIESDLVVNVESVPVEQLKFMNKNVQRSQAISLPEADLKKPRVIPAGRSEKFVKGCEVIARRDDKTWHKAVIHEVVAPGMLYVVKYGHNGQFSGAGPEDIVMKWEDISEGEKVGHDVGGEVKRADWSTGEPCISRWSQDNVWYNTVVIRALEGGYRVKFVDYGNEDIVVGHDMVRSVINIPTDSFVDENVEQNPVLENLVKSDSNVSESSPVTTDPEPTGASYLRVPRQLKPGSVDQARLLARTVPGTAGSGSCSVPSVGRNNTASLRAQAGVKVEPWSVEQSVRSVKVEKDGGLMMKVEPSSEDKSVRSVRVEKNGLLVMKLEPRSEQNLVKSVKEETDGMLTIKVEPRSELHASVKVERAGVSLNDNCLAKFSEDGVWYNGVVTDQFGDGSALVYFLDYGNSERVQAEDIVGGPEDVPLGEELDPHVQQIQIVNKVSNIHTEQRQVDRVDFTPPGQRLAERKKEGSSDKMNFLSLSTLEGEGLATMATKQTLTINDLKGPIGVTVLADGSLAVVCRGANSVSRYNREGVFLGNIRPGREFVQPSDILTLSSGEFAVRDGRGIQLFSMDQEFIKFLAEEWIDLCFGLAEDQEGRIITINCNGNSVDKSRVKITSSNSTDIFFIDKISSKVVKRIEMVDLIEEAARMLPNLQMDQSACRFLAFSNNKLYVVDLGLDCVFILDKDGTESDVFGSRGTSGGEFRDPAGLVVDASGNMMVVDSRNHRLQLIDRNLAFAGIVKVDTPLARPSGIYIDHVNRDIIVSNYQGKSVVKYKMIGTI